MLRYIFCVFLVLMSILAGISNAHSEWYVVTFEDGRNATAIFVSAHPGDDKTFCVLNSTSSTIESGYYDVSVVQTVWGN